MCHNDFKKISLEFHDQIHPTVLLVSCRDCDHVAATGLRGLACLEKGHSFIFLEASQASSVIIPVIHQTLQVQVRMAASSAPAVPISERLFLSAAFLASSALVGALPSLTPRRTWPAQISKIWRCVPM